MGVVWALLCPGLGASLHSGKVKMDVAMETFEMEVDWGGGGGGGGRRTEREERTLRSFKHMVVVVIVTYFRGGLGWRLRGTGNTRVSWQRQLLPYCETDTGGASPED